MGISSNGIALCMSIIAGLATTIGGFLALAFSHRIKPVPFAGALSFAGGVMTFVSFVEIYAEGQEYIIKGFVERNLTSRPEEAAYCVAMTLFFCGWWFASWMDACVHMLLDWHTARGIKKQGETVEGEGMSYAHRALAEEVLEKAQSDEQAVPEIDMEAQRETKPLNGFKKALRWIQNNELLMRVCGTEILTPEEQAEAAKRFKDECHKITRLGYFTAFVLALHNFPEGVAEFTGGAADRKLGLGICIAIGIHNIPEGLAVAVPILFGTGSKWKAMIYTIVSGLAEPIGGAFAWGVIGNEPDALSFGILFMLTCGIMVNVALKELLFTAVRYDPGNRITSLAFTVGMIVMAISLMSLTLSGAA
eukprot:Blabericola_migrator_1__4313@NODE_2324_length_2937_cov_215_669686_g1457_i0_p1_GENE_NODE_2324_length_2937_cov_215_669686_g1457_i0NODE_2324_length_2937_cov_215_669686_g1457_i0_p1_ORF_typecomplete_len363_score59_03Zip/PF02535_22/6_4e43UPF0220/PF05255_11/3_1e03UPF0220/PF05255_11/0_11UPF0220/PF05255_11/8_4e02TMEM240/PF15207_6/0_25E1E2_ATPase/PF00122_20/0_73E1E2_ATPase/PF00122_20/2_9e03ALMT/PF11744_8/1_4ALMT/PF11744_8/2_7e02YdjM/PF04307_14/0_23YdjM/PF04307_14/8_4e02zfLITAFlike/PF10601_9/2_1zfLITAFlike